MKRLNQTEPPIFIIFFVLFDFYFTLLTVLSRWSVPVLVLLFVALWFILRGNLFYVLPCVILFLCFSVLLALRLPRLGKRELILVLFVRLFDLRLFGFICFLFLLVIGKGCGLRLWHLSPFLPARHILTIYLHRFRQKYPLESK